MIVTPSACVDLEAGRQAMRQIIRLKKRPVDPEVFRKILKEAISAQKEAR